MRLLVASVAAQFDDGCGVKLDALLGTHVTRILVGAPNSVSIRAVNIRSSSCLAYLCSMDIAIYALIVVAPVTM